MQILAKQTIFFVALMHCVFAATQPNYPATNALNIYRPSIWIISSVCAILIAIVILLLLNMSRRIKAEQALLDSEQKLAAQLKSIPIPTITLHYHDNAFFFTNFNDEACRLTDDSAAHMIGKRADTFFNQANPQILIDILDCYKHKTIIRRSLNYTNMFRHGIMHLFTTYVYVPNDIIMVHLEDVSEKLKLEEQLQQSQKMEAIGRLAGGVAHDFNNLLTAINGNAELLLKQVFKGDPLREGLEEIKKAGDHASSLTRQLLAFSRKQALSPQVIDLNDVVSEMEKMLHRIIGEDIELVTNFDPDLELVYADQSQIEQVILNLAINARDAMPRGGKLSITTRTVTFDETTALDRGIIQQGVYAMVSVADNGSGMSDDVKIHIFEPFFTTKVEGKGTGLGLATVYGIVKQSNGAIWVDSELGRGSEFSVYIPRSRVSSVPDDESSRKELLRGFETVLLVEDNVMVRSLTQKILQKNGYRVIPAADGHEAIEKSSAHNGIIQIMISDVVMPHMSGEQLKTQILLHRPDIKILFMSGYPESLVNTQTSIEAGVFIQKPFSSETLLKKVRALIDVR